MKSKRVLYYLIIGFPIFILGKKLFNDYDCGFVLGILTCIIWNLIDEKIIDKK